MQSHGWGRSTVSESVAGPHRVPRPLTGKYGSPATSGRGAFCRPLTACIINRVKVTRMDPSPGCVYVGASITRTRLRRRISITEIDLGGHISVTMIHLGGYRGHPPISVICLRGGHDSKSIYRLPAEPGYGESVLYTQIWTSAFPPLDFK